MADSPNRFHVTLHLAGQPARHGWWASEATARRKALAWYGEHGGRVTLVDEETGETLTEWPGVVGGPE